MEALNLKAERRETTGREVKYLRQVGFIPAVLYGKGLDTISLQIEEKTLGKVLAQAGTYQLISLQIDQDKPLMAMARDIQRDVIKHDYLHVDFYAVRMGEKVTAQVPLILEGESPAVKDQGGILTQGLDEIEIECLPSDLISAISVSVEGLTEFHDLITIADLALPASVTVLSDPDSVVAKVEPPRLEEELEALEEEAAVSAEPEVLTEAREREEEVEPEETGEEGEE